MHYKDRACLIASTLEPPTLRAAPSLLPGGAAACLSDCQSSSKQVADASFSFDEFCMSWSMPPRQCTYNR